jgi:hypothetical protein
VDVRLAADRGEHDLGPRGGVQALEQVHAVIVASTLERP